MSTNHANVLCDGGLSLVYMMFKLQVATWLLHTL